VKKNKVMVISKKGDELISNLVINGISLEQVADLKYSGRWNTEDGTCERKVKIRIAMAKETFWQNKELLRGNLKKKSIKKGMLEFYVFSALRYACPLPKLDPEQGFMKTSSCL